MSEDMTYEPVMDWRKRAQDAEESREFWQGAARLYKDKFERSQTERERDLEAQLNAAILGQQKLERENAELRKAYEPVEKSFRVVWTACAFGYEGTPVGEAFNHIKAWFDGVRL